ncbi:hypothetical protein JOM56_012298 [Amanita muscaria]
MIWLSQHPWSDGDEENLQLQILEDEIEIYEEDGISEECQDFIRQMLQKEPTKRLRIGEDMTAHPFFAGVDWVAMRNRAVSPPWAPDFVSGHHFFPTWESLEMFEPGLLIDTDDDEFKALFSLLQNWGNASKHLLKIFLNTVPKTKMMTRNRTIRTSRTNACQIWSFAHTTAPKGAFQPLLLLFPMRHWQPLSTLLLHCSNS